MASSTFSGRWAALPFLKLDVDYQVRVFTIAGLDVKREAPDRLSARESFTTLQARGERAASEPSESSE